MARRPAVPRPGAPMDPNQSVDSDRGFVADHATGPAHVIDLVRHTLPPVHRAGWPFVAVPAAVAVLGRRRRWIRTPAVAGAVACAAFFRHPDRVPPTQPGAVVAPADGEITLVDTAVPPPELGLGEVALPRVSTFLSVLDVHVQRAPVTGEVVSVTHTPGRFLSADLPAASSENERTCVCVRQAGGAQVGVVQIAGLLARRIVCNVAVGEEMRIGQTYGLIRFGSRVDVYLPAGTSPGVRPGQRAVGAETLFAVL